MSGVAALSLEDDSTEEIDPNLYFERRLKHLETMKVFGCPALNPVCRAVRDSLFGYLTCNEINV